MPFDGGLFTGLAAAYAYKKIKDHRKKKNERERDRLQYLCVNLDSTNTVSKYNASEQAQIGAGRMPANIASTPAYVTNVNNMTNVGMGTTPPDLVWHNLYQHLQTMNNASVPPLTSMGEGKSRVQVPRSPLRTQPRFKRPGMAGSRRNGPRPPPPSYAPPPFARRT